SLWVGYFQQSTPCGGQPADSVSRWRRRNAQGRPAYRVQGKAVDGQFVGHADGQDGRPRREGRRQRRQTSDRYAIQHMKRIIPLCLCLFVVTPMLLGAVRPPLLDAVKNGDKEALRTLLQKGTNVNVTDGDGTTALHWASYRDDL